MSQKIVLIADRFSTESLLYLKQFQNLEIKQLELNSENEKPPWNSDPTYLEKINGLIIRSKTQIDETLLKKAPQLQLIISCTSGFDHIDLSATKRWGITVMHTPLANRESAAQLTWSLVLNCAQKIKEAQTQVASGNWNRDLLWGLELCDKTYGIVGLGRIGSRVAEIASAFGMKVVAFDPYLDDDIFIKYHAKRLSYEELLKTSDVISFHVPQTLETQRMLSLSQIEYIQRGAILINTSRGSVISEEDLCFALDQKWIRAAGLDVFQKEPLPVHSKLNSYKQVVLTPHIGGNTEDAFYKASQDAAEKCARFFMDGSTEDTLPPQVPWYGARGGFNLKK